MMYLILSIILLAASPLIQPLNPVVADIGRWIGIVLAAGWCLLWLPFKRHEQREMDFNAEKSSLIQTHNTEQVNFKAQLESERQTHEQEKTEMGNRIRSLQDQFNDQSERRVNKHILGAFLDRIEGRIRILEKMSATEFRDGLKNGEDSESLDLVNWIRSFITKNIGQGEAAAFSSLAGLILTKFNEPDWGYLRDLDEANIKRIHMIEHLNHWAIQLKEIIKNYK